MALTPDPSVVAEAEQLLLDLKNHTGSPADQANTLRQVNKLRCHLENGPDALMCHSFPVRIARVYERSTRKAYFRCWTVPSPPGFENDARFRRV